MGLNHRATLPLSAFPEMASSGGEREDQGLTRSQPSDDTVRDWNRIHCQQKEKSGIKEITPGTTTVHSFVRYTFVSCFSDLAL